MSEEGYCPLCGAHEMEQGEGFPSDVDELLKWEDRLMDLIDKFVVSHASKKGA